MTIYFYVFAAECYTTAEAVMQKFVQDGWIPQSIHNSSFLIRLIVVIDHGHLGRSVQNNNVIALVLLGSSVEELLVQ